MLKSASPLVYAVLTFLLISSSTTARDPAERPGPAVLTRFKPNAPTLAVDPLGAQQAATAPWKPDTAYQGIRVGKSSSLSGAPDGFQESVIALLELIDFVPRERLDHYQWVKRYGGVITGWQAQIVEVSETPGGAVVSLRVYPRQNSGATVLNDSALENYLIVGGKVQFLHVAFEDGPKITTFN